MFAQFDMFIVNIQLTISSHTFQILAKAYDNSNIANT